MGATSEEPDEGGSVCHEGSRRRQLDEKWGSQFGLSVPRGRGHGFRRLKVGGSSLGPIRESLLGASGAVGGGCTCVRRFWGMGLREGGDLSNRYLGVGVEVKGVMVILIGHGLFFFQHVNVEYKFW